MNNKILICLIVLGLFVSSCQQAPEPDSVTLQLKWIHQAQFAGYYVAQELGYYQEENIELSILPGGPEVDYFQVLEDGKADFAVARPEGIFLERAEGNLITAVAVIYQINPFLLVSKQGSGITSPEDFPGKVVALAGTGSNVQFDAMLKNLEIDPDTINFVPFEFDYKPFVEGEVDVLPSFAAGSLLDVEQLGIPLNYIWPSDYGVDWYSDTLVVADRLLDENPELVERFVRATLQGHQYAFTHPEEAAEISLNYAEIQDYDLQLEMLRASIPLIHTGSVKLGEMDPAVWDSMQQDLLDQGLLESPQPLDEIFDESLVNAFHEGEQ
jgi:NitT/TauT family transport system substrate-binding protein